jgi:hypothetical protein
MKVVINFIFPHFIRKTRQLIRNKIENVFIKANYTGYFTSDNEPDGIENTTHNTFAKVNVIFDLENLKHS